MLSQNEMFAPSIMPSLMAMSPPSGPAMEPFNMAPSALKLNETGKSPLGVETLPVHFPSTSAAKADTVSSNNAAADAKNLMGETSSGELSNMVTALGS